MKKWHAVTMVVVCLLTGSAWAARDYTTNEVTITILNQGGAPVSGAKVRAWSDSWGHFQPWDRYATAVTDTSGQVKFKMIVGEWSIFAAAPGLYLADTHHKVTPKTREITVRPNATLTLEGKDLDGSPLNDTEILIQTLEHRPVVPMMLPGKLVNGNAELAVMGRQFYSVMLVRKPAPGVPGLALYWDHVRGKYSFEPKREELRRFALRAQGVDGGPGEIEAKFFFPELACIWDYRNNPGEFTLHVTEPAEMLMSPAYVGVEATLLKDGWRYRYYPNHFDLQRDNETEVTYGGQHRIAPRVYGRKEFESATWIFTQDPAGHLIYEAKNPDGKEPRHEFHFRDGDGKELYGKAQKEHWGPALRFDTDLTTGVLSWDGAIDYGPLGKRTFKGDPHADEFAYRTERIANGAHFEIMASTDPQFKPQIEAALEWLETVWREYGVLWGLTPDLRPKRMTVTYVTNPTGRFGGVAYGTNIDFLWLTDLLHFTDPRRNALCHMQNILSHEYFHNNQFVPEIKWGGRTLYPDPWIGESMPQIGMNRVYASYYGPVVAKMHQGLYLQGTMKRMAGEKTAGSKESVWEEISYENGDQAHRRASELLGDPEWKPWDWMAKSGVDVPVALLALYKHVTGKNYAYMARLIGDESITDEAVDEATEMILEDGKSPFPEKCDGAFIKNWLVLGPFEDKKHEFLKKEQTANEGALRPKEGEELLGKKWIAFKSDREDGFVDMEKPLGVVDNSGGYAYTIVKASKKCKGYMWFGSDDGAKLWINGRIVVDRDFHRPATPDDFIVPVKLRKGENTILIKIDEDSAWWGFYLRFGDRDGKAIAKQ